MTLSTTAPPAGWFPDPGDASQERWWSGEAWTEHHREAPAGSEPAAGHLEEPVAAAAEPQYVFEMTPAAEPEPEPAAAPAPVAPVAAGDESAVHGDEPVRRTLPTFEELLAAAAAPAPAPETAAFDAAPPAPESWMPKSYGARAEPEAPTQATTDTAGLAAPSMSVFDAAPLPALVFGAPLPPEPAMPAMPAATAEPALPPIPAAAVPPLPAFPAAPALPPVTEVQLAAAPAAPTPPMPAPAPQAPVLQTQAPVPHTPTPAPAAPAAPAAPVMPAGFVASQPTADPGLVMPSAPILDNTPPRAEQSARHAEVVPELAPPAPSAPAAPAPVGYTASADPAVANRYRQALHNPEPDPAEPDPFAAPVMGPYPTAPSGLAAPNQPGWQGMPLPGPGAAAFSPPVPTAGYATTVAAAADAGHNKTAWSALGSGALAIGLAIFFLFFDRIGLWPALLAIAAIVQGIIGAVHSRRVRKGAWAAAGAIVLGVGALGVMGSAAISWAVDPEYTVSSFEIENDIVAYGHEYGIEVTSAECPRELTGTVGTHFSCTAYDEAGAAYPVDVLVDADGYFVWEIVEGSLTDAA